MTRLFRASIAVVSMHCCIPFVALLLIGGDPPVKGDATKDRDKLQGEWSVVSWESKNRSLTAEQVKKSNLIVNGDEWQPTVDGEKMIKMNVKLDPSKTPKEIHFTLLEKFAGITDFSMKGIYKIEGDTLTICRTTKPAVDRPKEFKAGESLVLIVVKRVEKK